MMHFFDSHAHLPENFSGDVDSYLKRAMDASVSKIVLLGNEKKECDRLAGFAAEYSNLYFAAGIHPHDASGEEAKNIEHYADYSLKRHYVAVGEIGLDYYYDFSPREAQISLFERFLSLALHLDKPAVVHCRDKEGESFAYDDAYALLKPFSDSGGRFVMHSYAGSPEDVDRFLAIGAYFGVCGMITFKRADNIRELAKLYPSERIMLETDSPYLTPVPFRGQENHPANVSLTAEKLAETRGWSLDYTTDLTWRNAMDFFRINDYV